GDPVRGGRARADGRRAGRGDDRPRGADGDAAVGARGAVRGRPGPALPSAERTGRHLADDEAGRRDRLLRGVAGATGAVDPGDLSEPAVYLVTGPMAAGKTTVARLLAGRFARGVHLEGD